MRPASCPSGRSRLLLRAYDGLGSIRSFEIQRRYSKIDTSPTIQGGVRNCPLGSTSHSNCRGGFVVPSAVTGAEETAMQIIPGSVYPLGPSAYHSEDGSVAGVNFAVASAHAKNVQLVLFDVQGEELSTLNLFFNEEEGVWHGAVPDLPQKDILYGVKVSGDGGWETPFRWDSQRVLLDPWAPYVVGRSRFGMRDGFERFVSPDGSRFLGTYCLEEDDFDWGDDYDRPNIPENDLIIMELAVRSFTASPTSGLDEEKRGTFAGVAEKVDHLVDLGINAVELLPVFEYDELEFQRHKNPRDHMTNIWGYSHLSFLAPMSRFGSQTSDNRAADSIAAAREFKEMVKTLHSRGIEVIVDVVYNHTAESDDADPYLLSWRGIDALEYYQQIPGGHPALVNLSGCGNTVNVNGRRGKELVIESLVRWVEEYHVDGFRFDLASCLCRDSQGNAMDDPPLIREIAKHPVLSKVKLIAEPWDLGMYQVGSFPAHGKWSEWNGKYRDDVRKFIKGDEGMKPALATRLSGSEDLYGSSGRKPYNSINFVIAHDGFTLADLVSYNDKHNDANGENNMDGTNDNFSWNCGVEGPAHNQPHIQDLRYKQMKNIHVALMMSQGTPMILSGDEYGQTRHGNNNWYGHDNDMTQFDWNQLKENEGWYRFYKSLIHFRRTCPLLGKTDFLTGNCITWHEDRWHDPDSKFLAFTLHDRDQEYGMVVAGAELLTPISHLQGTTWKVAMVV
ncbi:hypothetical protein M9435_003302 [Picochlorum sp. BPE23]|nr:hypothetical protein M9435_003302 [Picochlorum sp. BPE23]